MAATETKTETKTVNGSPGVLDQSIAETTRRVQSVRNTAAQFLGVPPERACDLLRQVWQTSKEQPDLTDGEMFVGMSMIARFGLDPISREVYVTRTSKGLVTIIGVDGWIKILDRTDHYDGHEQEEVEDEKGNVVEVITRIHSKARKIPTSYRARMSEYKKLAGPVAGIIPIHMLGIYSLRHAARRFTPIGGSVVTEEEARWMDAYDDAGGRDALPQTVEELTERLSKQEPPAEPSDPLAGAGDRLQAAKTKKAVAKVVEEVSQHPDGLTDDQAMQLDALANERLAEIDKPEGALV